MVDDDTGAAPAPANESSAPAAAAESALTPRRRVGRLRAPIPRWQAIFLGLLCIGVALGIWWFLTWGESAEDRIVSPIKLPSVAETFGSFKSLWFDGALTRNTFASLRRVVLGFLLAAAIGVPVGILCGCFRRMDAFLAPLTIFGRNIPMAALIPLTFTLFGIDEFQKIMFIFIAAVAFIISDAAQAIRDVDGRYIDTAYTLGASRRQTIMKVLVPLAMPNIFNSLRLLFGLAFGYIMLAEVITTSDEAPGLGGIINIFQRRGMREPIYLILLIIPVIALVIDRALFWVQTQLFPFRYGGAGWLAKANRSLIHGWESLKGLFFKPMEYDVPGSAGVEQPAGTATREAPGQPATPATSNVKTHSTPAPEPTTQSTGPERTSQQPTEPQVTDQEVKRDEQQ